MEFDIIKEAQNTFNIEISELERVKNRINENFEKLVYMINGLEHRKVVVTGIGKSGIIGKKIAATLASTGTSAIFINSAEALHGDLGMISEGDIVIAISNSGNSDEILSIMTPIKKIGAEIVAFTGNETSPLAKHAKVVINIGVEKEASNLGTAPMSSTTATLVMGDALAAVLMKMRNFTENDFAKYHPGGSLGKRLLLTVSDLMHSGEELPVLATDENIENVLPQENNIISEPQEAQPQENNIIPEPQEIQPQEIEKPEHVEIPNVSENVGYIEFIDPIENIENVEQIAQPQNTEYVENFVNEENILPQEIQEVKENLHEIGNNVQENPFETGNVPENIFEGNEETGQKHNIADSVTEELQVDTNDFSGIAEGFVQEEVKAEENVISNDVENNDINEENLVKEEKKEKKIEIPSFMK